MMFATKYQGNRSHRRDGAARRFAITLVGFLIATLWNARGALADATVVDITAKSSPQDFADKLPTSGSFVLQYTFDGDVADAAVDIWPQRIKACNGEPPERAARQTYHLVFSLNAAADGKTVGKTTVPHLQVSQVFCFKFSTTTKASPDSSKLLAVTQKGAKLIGTPDEAHLLAQALLAEAAKNFCEPNPRAKSTAAAAAARCAPIDIKPLEQSLLLAVVAAFTDQTNSQSQTAILNRFDAALVSKKASASQFRPPADLVNKVPSDAWVKLGVTQGGIARALDDVEANKKKLGPATSQAMQTWLNELKNDVTRFEDQGPKEQAASAQTAASKPKALSAQSEIALAFFKENLRATSTTSLDVDAETNDFKNYVSPEIGIALAHPFAKHSTATLIPYSAVNIYCQPVDRELALDKLVNPFCQRASLSVGLTLTQDLKVQSAELSAPALGSFVVVGAGYRILPFARVAALLVIAKETPQGGLSQESKLLTAGALAISGDVDVITFIGNSVK
jgi:hypothetical protein